MSLKDYKLKRKFNQTPEPPGKIVWGKGPLRFVIQMHQASRLHFDFRIEAGGVLKSWAVPKGPSLNAQDQRLAVQVEDHPVDYGEFEGIIPSGNYGAGTVMVWDEGTYLERNSSGRADSEAAVLKGLEKGHITLLLTGKKLQGEFALVRLKKGEDEKAWLLIKKRDEYSSYKDVLKQNISVKTGRNLQEIAQGAEAKGEVWLPKRSERKLRTPKLHLSSSKGSGEIQTEKLPRNLRPMLATDEKEPFDDKGWIFEFEYGGLRTLAEVDQRSVHLFSKQRLSFDQKFIQVKKTLESKQLSAILDGEVIQDSEGKLIYWVRDLLHLEGKSLRELPLLERKKRLQKLNIFDEVIRYSPHETQFGKKHFEIAGDEGYPSILARASQSRYSSGTSRDWLRISTAAEKKDTGPRLTHLSKVYWPNEKITKGDVVEYYREIAPVLLPYLENRPQSLHRFPDGIEGGGFFQKNLIGHHPKWVSTTRIFSESSGKSVDYLLCQNESTLLYMANLGCIELNPWLSQIESLEKPDTVVIDLDPDENDFSETVSVAKILHKILERIEAFHLCKTSGATGLHFYIPVQAGCSYNEGRAFAETICQEVHRQTPELTSLERSPAKRRGKIYLDCLQNVQGQTVASVYSIRPRAGAPISTPIKWQELTSKLNPNDFHLRNVLKRLEKQGDLWAPILKKSVDLNSCLSRFRKEFPNRR